MTFAIALLLLAALGWQEYEEPEEGEDEEIDEDDLLGGIGVWG